MVTHTLKTLLHMLQDFQSVSDHFGTLCIKGLGAFQTAPPRLVALIEYHFDKALVNLVLNFCGFFHSKSFQKGFVSFYIIYVYFFQLHKSNGVLMELCKQIY